MKTSAVSASRGIFRKLVIYGVAGLFICYALAVGAGYCWLRFVRKNDQIAFVDVALFRISAVRHRIAAQHFIKAQAAWEAKDFQAAYLFFSAGVRQDPDNVGGRLTAARFLRSVGAGNLALTMLEEGLARSAEDRRLIEPTFELLLGSGRNTRVLELLKQRYGAELSGQNSALLQRYEVEATLAENGPPAARQLLEKHPTLLQDPLAARIVARVFWETRERSKAIVILQQYLQGQKGIYADYALLAGWQEAAGQPGDAVQTARRAVEKFSGEIPPRVLLIEMLVAENPAGSAGLRAIADYLRDFGSQPGSLSELAVLAGRKGWVDLNRTLYELSANTQRDLSAVAFAYSDSFVRVSRFKEARQILTELEAQLPEGGAGFLVQLRQRQVIVSAALGDSDNVREYARRLASTLSREPDGLDACRRIFRKMGIVDAVAELSGRSLAANNPPKKL